METTRLSLLMRVRNLQDADSWHEFHEVYGPLIMQALRCRGIPHTDALDLTQEVLVIVVGQIGSGKFQYDPGKGSFRRWLRVVTRNRAMRFFRERGKQAHAHGGSGPLPDIEFWDADRFEAEWRLQRLRIASDRVRHRVQAETWTIFERLAAGESSEEVAREFGTTVGNVYQIKSRIVNMLRETVEEIDE